MDGRMHAGGLDRRIRDLTQEREFRRIGGSVIRGPPGQISA
jgi:hypothetical protein